MGDGDERAPVAPPGFVCMRLILRYAKTSIGLIGFEARLLEAFGRDNVRISPIQTRRMLLSHRPFLPPSPSECLFRGNGLERRIAGAFKWRFDPIFLSPSAGMMLAPHYQRPLLLDALYVRARIRRPYSLAGPHFHSPPRICRR